MSRRDVFGHIYREGLWRRDKSLSGAGSDRAIAQPYVDYVLNCVAVNGYTSVLDIGHGDWEMWPPDAFDGVQYVGIDVALGLSEKVTDRHGGPFRSFSNMDAVEDSLPLADLVLIKEVLQHLSNDDVASLLKKVGAYGHVIICSDIQFPSWRWLTLSSAFQRLRQARFRMCAANIKRAIGSSPENTEISTGGYRPLNLENPPWDLDEFGLRIIERKDLPHPIWHDALLERRVWFLEGTYAAAR